jgi:hypothetical protein
MTEQASDPKVKIQVLKSQAVRQAMFEILGEQREEIIKRAQAKLVAMGIQVKSDELGDAISHQG